MRPSRTTTAAVAAAVLVGSLAVWASPAQAAVTGSIGGHVTAATGAPAGEVMVQALDADSYQGRGFTTTAADGSYRLDGLAAGHYIVSFNGADYAEQYFDGQTQIYEADPVAVTAGQLTTVDEDLLATGILTGRLTDSTGAPLESGLVRIYRADDQIQVGSGGIFDGVFRVAVPTGTYVVSFQPYDDLYQEQYVPGKLSENGAQRFVVTADQETTVNDTALTTGSLSGRVTRSDGTAAGGIHLYATPFNGSGGGESATTNSNGDFSVPRLLAGEYAIEFMVGDRIEYFDRASDLDQADPVTVIGGKDNRVTPSLLPTGSVRLRALDAITGATIRDFCAGGRCSNGTGQLVLTNLLAGPNPISVFSEANYVTRASTVNVLPNQTIDVMVRLLPGAKITTSVIDKATGKGLAGVCLFAYKSGQVYIPQGVGDDQCSDAAGKVTLSRLEAGDYRVFAMPRNTGYGRQWVTANGGSGDERQAVTIKATSGRTAIAPQVKIDRGGSIRGRVTDAATGAPLRSADVGTFTGQDQSTDGDGYYQIDGLGPYRWALSYAGGPDYAAAWTGGAVSRFTATGTQVTAGAVATVDVALTKGVTVHGNVLTGGRTPSWSRITAYNTTTGDQTGSVDFVGDAYELHVLPGQEIRFSYHVDIDGTTYRSDKVALSPATPGGPARYAVTVPAGGATIDLTIAIP
ncbi:carboxypeptidase regulatory-like domain-containing protein [Asanoa sp. NPDC049573]|uniref:carboxypeptidase regulatory-like domain-containing protein n=1 Tax=Asanoa sp. NPDC049573 TaxID=3155396 RepID=UPI003422F4E5